VIYGRLLGSYALPGIPYSSLTVGIPKEIFPHERRVALTPANAALLKKKGVSKVLVEHNAGTEAQFLNEQYTAAGATLVSREELFASSDIMLKVRPPLLEEEAKHIREGSTVISFLYPSQNKPLIELLAKRNVNGFVHFIWSHAYTLFN
jgi:NAD(P) transhydrogenase